MPTANSFSNSSGEASARTQTRARVLLKADEGPDDGLKTLARKTQRMVNQSVDLQNELQALLQRAHPELVQYVRGHMSQWVLRLIKRYPTPGEVVEAGPETLSEISYVTEKKARNIVKAAHTSVASRTDEDTGLTLSLVAEDLLRLEKRIDRLKERGKHQKVAEVACMRKLLAIVYGCWSNDERFDPTYEKRLKARQAEKKSASEASSERAAGQNFDMSAPVSRKEAKKRRKATSPEKSVNPSARGQGAFLEEHHNGASASGQA